MPFFGVGVTLNLPEPYGDDCECYATIECIDPGGRMTRNDPGYGPGFLIEKVMIDTVEPETMGRLYPLKDLTVMQIDRILRVAAENYDPNIWDDGCDDTDDGWEVEDVA